MLLPNSSPEWVQGRIGRSPNQTFLFDVMTSNEWMSGTDFQLDETQDACLKDGNKRAQAAYEKGDFCDGVDPYIQHVFGREAPFLNDQFPGNIVPEFATNALRVWRPLFSAVRRGESR